MNTSHRVLSLWAVVVAAGYLGGCNFHARGPEQFRKDTRALLQERDPQIQACYEEILKKDKQAAGEVTLSFTIKKDTGEFTDWKVGGSASDELKKCVEDAVQGVKLIPVDARDAEGEFTYVFKKKD